MSRFSDLGVLPPTDGFTDHRDIPTDLKNLKSPGTILLGKALELWEARVGPAEDALVDPESYFLWETSEGDVVILYDLVLEKAVRSVTSITGTLLADRPTTLPTFRDIKTTVR